MTDLIPEFDSNGLLPAGDYEVTFDELRRSTLVQGPANLAAYPNWDSSWRGWLVDQLETMTRQLWQVGITDVFADGSFAVLFVSLLLDLLEALVDSLTSFVGELG